MIKDNQTKILKIRDVSKVFESAGKSTQALTNINLDICSGEFVSLIGPSGCGKSTLLRLIGDLLSPTSGEITLNGKTPYQARLDRDYGIVFQTPVLFEWRNVKKNVMLPLEVFKENSEIRQDKASKMLSLVELSGFENHYPWQLSGGMQQRVSIARALSFKPALLLMDEPFGALDEMTRERMNALLLEIWEKTRTTIIFVTHSIPEAVFLSNRVVIMSPRPGQIEDIVNIDLTHPRDENTRENENYFHFVSYIREKLRFSEDVEPTSSEESN
jgi:NitT/TauT family transport system ATP-binding protein